MITLFIIGLIISLIRENQIERAIKKEYKLATTEEKWAYDIILG